MQYYSVHFTEKRLVDVYGTSGRDKGKKIRSYSEDIPRTIHMLPLSTAMQYKTCDNFRYEPYVPEASERINGSPNYRARNLASRKGKHVHMTHTTVPVRSKRASVNTSKSTSAIKQAAMSGDLAAAINAGE